MYKCIRSFYSYTLRDEIRTGEYISETKYNQLTEEEQSHFQALSGNSSQNNNDEDDIIETIAEVIVAAEVVETIWDLFTDNDETKTSIPSDSSPSNDNFDFGGGESGGAGADGSW